MEVAAVVDEDTLRTTAAIIRGKGGEVIPTARSKGGWYISPTKNSSISKLRKEVDACLAKLEAAGVHSFNAHLSDVPDQFIAELERLGWKAETSSISCVQVLSTLDFPRTAAL